MTDIFSEFLAHGIKSVDYYTNLIEFDYAIKNYNPQKRVDLVVYHNNIGDKWTIKSDC